MSSIEQKVRKSFRLSDNAVALLDKRDPILYRTETDFVEAAILSFGKTNCLGELEASDNFEIIQMKKQLAKLEERVLKLEGNTEHMEQEKFKLPDISGLDMEEVD